MKNFHLNEFDHLKWKFLIKELIDENQDEKMSERQRY